MPQENMHMERKIFRSLLCQIYDIFWDKNNNRIQNRSKQLTPEEKPK